MAELTYTEEELKKFSRSNNSLTIEELEGFFESATEQFIIPFLSEEFTETILDGSEDDAKVVKLFKQAVINFGLYLYSQDAAITIGSKGIYEFSNTDSGQGKASLANIARYEQNKLKTGHAKLELLLSYLEKSESFEVWNENAGDSYKEFLIKSVQEFQKHVNIRERRTVFLALRPGMRLATHTNIIPAITEALYEAIIANPDEEKYKILINRFLNPALANFALSYTIFEIAVMIGLEDTVAVFDNSSSTFLTQKHKTAPESLISGIAVQKATIGQTFLDQCLQFILDNPDDYPEYPHPAEANSEVYQNDEDSRVFYTGGFI
ncbi:DUF6712 family protein [Emticicia fontis]